jgi:hypothetical protein
MMLSGDWRPRDGVLKADGLKTLLKPGSRVALTVFAVGGLRLRMIEKMVVARGIIVSHETIRHWRLTLGQVFANQIRRRDCHMRQLEASFIVASQPHNGEVRGGRGGRNPAVAPVARSGSLSATGRAPISQRNGLSAAATILIAGCAGASLITETHYNVTYRQLEYLEQPDLPVIVEGNPFSIAQSELHRGVSDALQGTAFATAARFIPASDDPSAPYRVVMHFAGEAAGDALCARGRPSNSSPAAPSSAGRVHLVAILCRGDQAIAYAVGTVATKGGPEGVDFRDGVSQFSIFLFAPPTRRGHVI